jgi:hypothetical protein
LPFHTFVHRIYLEGLVFVPNLGFRKGFAKTGESHIKARGRYAAFSEICRFSKSSALGRFLRRRAGRLV